MFKLVNVHFIILLQRSDGPVTFLIPETKERSLEAISKEADSFGDSVECGIAIAMTQR